MHWDDYPPDNLASDDFVRLRVSLYSCKFIYITIYNTLEYYEVYFCSLFCTLTYFVPAKLDFRL